MTLSKYYCNLQMSYYISLNREWIKKIEVKKVLSDGYKARGERSDYQFRLDQYIFIQMGIV